MRRANNVRKKAFMLMESLELIARRCFEAEGLPDAWLWECLKRHLRLENGIVFKPRTMKQSDNDSQFLGGFQGSRFSKQEQDRHKRRNPTQSMIQESFACYVLH